MYFGVLFIPPFEKQLKKLLKKYPSLKNEFANLIKSLEKDPKQGKLIGNDCYKIRLAIIRVKAKVVVQESLLI